MVDSDAVRIGANAGPNSEWTLTGFSIGAGASAANATQAEIGLHALKQQFELTVKELTAKLTFEYHAAVQQIREDHAAKVMSRKSA